MIEEPPEAPRYRFDEFVLDVADRQFWRGDTRVDLSARYFDALVLLVRERGQLVEKNRFFDEVWSDVVAGAGGAGAAAGALIPLAGGHLMGGSLDLLAQSFAASRLQLDRFGPLFGELHFGPTTEAALGGVEGLLFGSCVVGTLTMMHRFNNGRSAPWRL